MGEIKSDFVIITATYEPEFVQLLKVTKRLGWKINEIKENRGTYIGLGPSDKPFLFYASYQTDPGMVSAAILSTKMIELYRPKYIVMLGVAAGFEDRRMPFGSILIADWVANYQKGKITKKRFIRDVDGWPLDKEIKKLLAAKKDKIIKDINRDLENSPLYYKEIKDYMGPIVTGNQVVASKDIMESIKNEYRKVVGVEMEGFAIFTAANEANKPNPLPILIKSVCDYGTKAKKDNYQPLASYASSQFFLRFAYENLEPIGLMVPSPPDIELVSMDLQKQRESNKLEEKLIRCKGGDIVKFISITNKSFLAPGLTYKDKDPFLNAIQHNIKFCGVVLDPSCDEAVCRSEIESPGIKELSERLLVKDSERVKDRLAKLMETSKEALKKRILRNLEIRYSQTGLSFKLWLFKDEAYIEPYHFGKLEDEKIEAEKALCGFSHIWIKKSAREYGILEDHFSQLWEKGQKLFPFK
jgi:nucleoside phosphorylase